MLKTFHVWPDPRQLMISPHALLAHRHQATLHCALKPLRGTTDRPLVDPQLYQWMFLEVAIACLCTCDIPGPASSQGLL
jgi:hypothetical protein